MDRRIVTQLVVLVAIIVVIEAQKKPGDCPPPGQGTCFMRCYKDTECGGSLKCCRTSCGGSSCITAVTTAAVPEASAEKHGSCPANPSGPWVCSSRCSTDADCVASQKCCKNRCGASACMKPE